jgi:DNA modification methylase
VPSIRLSNLTEEQIRAYRLADNQLGLDSEWDLDVLARELGDLEGKIDLDYVGFDPKELQKLLAKDEQNQFDPDLSEDDSADTPIEAVSHYGQVWQLGKHRLACGDCTDPEVVNPLLAGVSINLMVTDPPYGVNYDAGWRNEALGNAVKRDLVVGDHHADWRGAFAYFKGNIMYIWHGGLQSGTVFDMINSCGFDVKGQIIWVKPSIVINRGAYNWQHEPCYYAVRRGQQANWQGPANASTIWEVASINQLGSVNNEDANENDHATQKPVELMRRPILYHTLEGEVVYDPFLGSGSTLIAAESTGRICYGVELVPKNVEATLLRWQKLTGQEAVCDRMTYREHRERVI